MKKNSIRLGLLKHNALKLGSTKQLPHLLVKAIIRLTNDTKEEVVKYLLNASEHFLRVKGYYKKYPQVEKEFEKAFRQDLEKLGYLGLLD